MDFFEIPDRLISMLFPQRCAFCGAATAYDDFWCGKCGKNGNPPFSKMGRMACDFPHSFTDALGAFEYSGRIRNAIWLLKDRADRRTLRFFTDEMIASMSEHWEGIRFGIAVPVPATASRLEEKGFNHAETLAIYVGRSIGVTVLGDALCRRETTRVQRDLTAAERRVNAAASYGIGNPEGLKGETILLVDDVFTTGSTAAACSDRLLEAGANRVYVLAAACSPLRDGE